MKLSVHNGITPVHWIPDCIAYNLREAVVVNAVGLSGPGAQNLFERGEWQRRPEPFQLSFMSVEKTKDARLLELERYAALAKRYKSSFSASFALQVNYSCPNVGLKREGYDDLFDEITLGYEIVKRELDVPFVPKFSVHTPPEFALRIEQAGFADALCVSNTLPWLEFAEADRIRWFGSVESPLRRRNPNYGDGGVSGAPLTKLTVAWTSRARELGVTIPILAGGGILRPQDVLMLNGVGASAVFIGSVAILRPWRMRSIIERAWSQFGKE